MVEITYFYGKNDKAGGVPRKGFLDLKSKMCTSITQDNCQPKNAKGINKNVTGVKLKHEDYKKFFIQQIIDETWNEQN